MSPGNECFSRAGNDAEVFSDRSSRGLYPGDAIAFDGDVHSVPGRRSRAVDDANVLDEKPPLGRTHLELVAYRDLPHCLRLRRRPPRAPPTREIRSSFRRRCSSESPPPRRRPAGADRLPLRRESRAESRGRRPSRTRGPVRPAARPARLRHGRRCSGRAPRACGTRPSSCRRSRSGCSPRETSSREEREPIAPRVASRSTRWGWRLRAALR